MWKQGLVGAVLVSSAWAQVTQRVSLGSGGEQGNLWSVALFGGAISADGRYVAFISEATNFVPGDTNGEYDVFVRDRVTGLTTRANVSSTGAQSFRSCNVEAISGDGRFVTFAANEPLVPEDTNNCPDVYLRDLVMGTTEIISVGNNGIQGSNSSFYSSISDDGRYVAFVSWASNLTPGDTNNIEDIFVRDRLTGTTECVSSPSSPLQHPSNWNAYCQISGNGRYVAFQTFDSYIIPGLTPDQRMNVFVRDRLSGALELINVDPNGNHVSGGSAGAHISSDGHFVAFSSYGDGVVAGDTNGRPDVFVRDRWRNTAEQVSEGYYGYQPDGPSYTCGISGDGRYVLFVSRANNLVPDDTNHQLDMFVWDRVNRTTERIDLASDGAQSSLGCDYSGAISSDGRFVMFDSTTNNLVPGDTNQTFDVFVRDRLGGPTFTSLCDPGSAGVIACPCSNSAGGSVRGCDNSSATGGATLSATGGTYISSDSLEFHVNGTTPSALSLLLQGTATIPTGAVYGQGVRCVGGTLTRLGTKHANGGSITIPDFEVGDPQVTGVSAAKGDRIHAGDSRYYLVYYRDPVVLGRCPASSTFNCTQTGMVTWSP